jgi:hypothetical protein
MILLTHDHINESNIVVTGGRVHGEYVPTRTYENKNHFVEIDAPVHIQDNDIVELYALGYRLATPYEQETYRKSFLKTTEIHETIEPIKSIQEKNSPSKKYK